MTVQRVAEAHVVQQQFVVNILQNGSGSHSPVFIFGIGQIAHAVIDNEPDDLAFLNMDIIRPVLAVRHILGRLLCGRVVGKTVGRMGCICRRFIGLGNAGHALFARLLLLAFFAPLLEEFGAILLDLSQDGLLVHVKQVAALLGINHAGDFVRYDGNGLDHIGDGSSAFDGVVLGVLEHHARLKIDEVSLVLLDVFLNLGKAMGANKRVRIVLGRQRQYLDIQTFFQQHVHAANGCFDTSSITVEHLGHIAREAANGMNMPLGERRS